MVSLLITAAELALSILFPTPPCDEEDGTVTSGGIAVESCYWDAQAQGNGTGESFTLHR